MVNRFLDHLEEWLITFLIGAATVIIFFAVVHRYATGFATGGLQDVLLRIDMSWAQELTIFMFVWMINNLSDRVRRKFIIFGLLGGALFTAIIGSFGAHFVWELMHTEQVSADLEMPKWLVYACIPLGSYLMCYRFLQVTWTFYKTGHLPHADHGHVEGLDKEAEIEWAVMPSDLHPRDVKPGAKP
jgi:C4-dicarboxylate transporter, DctQ subunit